MNQWKKLWEPRIWHFVIKELSDPYLHNSIYNPHTDKNTKDFSHPELQYYLCLDAMVDHLRTMELS